MINNLGKKQFSQMVKEFRMNKIMVLILLLLGILSACQPVAESTASVEPTPEIVPTAGKPDVVATPITEETEQDETELIPTENPILSIIPYF